MWDKPADPEKLGQWLKALAPFYNQNLPMEGLAKSAVATSEALVAGGFTGPEISFALRRMWTDRSLYWCFAKNYPMNPALFIPHIHELRKLQAALMFPSKMEMVQRLCAEFPDELHPGDFGYAGDDGFRNKLYRYKRAHLIREYGRTSKRLRATPEHTAPADHYTQYLAGGQQ